MFEITADDVATVLKRHESDVDAEEVFDDLFGDDLARIEKAFFAYTDFDDQVLSMLSELEDVLIEGRVIIGQKAFEAP